VGGGLREGWLGGRASHQINGRDNIWTHASRTGGLVGGV
jgi:hypothetical protein